MLVTDGMTHTQTNSTPLGFCPLKNNILPAVPLIYRVYLYNLLLYANLDLFNQKSLNCVKCLLTCDIIHSNDALKKDNRKINEKGERVKNKEECALTGSKKGEGKGEKKVRNKVKERIKEKEMEGGREGIK